MKVGDNVATIYGPGQLLGYKEIGKVYEVQLPFGKLFAQKDALHPPPPPTATQMKNMKNASPVVNGNKKPSAMEINDAYEALDKMRRLNLEVTCQEHGISTVDYDRCVTCLLTSGKDEQRQQQGMLAATGSSSARFPRLKKLIAETKRLKPKRPCSPCLICGNPVCSNHTSSTFRVEKVNVCLECEKLFNFEYVVDCLIMDNRERQERINHMIDLYDRTVLLLKYSSQYIDDVATSLEEAMARQNKIGVGGSTAGIMSGALGIAAAATILTPAGPPLLVASLLFGGSATAVQTGTEVKNRYFSEPHQLAANILALHGMQKNIVKVADTIRDAVARDIVIMDRLKEGNRKKGDDSALPEKIAEIYEQNRGGFLAGLTAGRMGMAGMEIGQMATAAEAGAVSARNARFFSRTSSNLLRTARFARFAGGAISAATMLLEAKCMQDTIRHIKEGNPCEKAQSLRRIQEELADIPSTANLDKECETYLEAMKKRDRRMTEQEAVRLLIETTQAQEKSERLAEEELVGGLIVNGEEERRAPKDKGTKSNRDARSQVLGSKREKVMESGSMSASLLERIQHFKKLEASVSEDPDPASIDEAPADLLG